MPSISARACAGRMPRARRPITRNRRSSRVWLSMPGDSRWIVWPPRRSGPTRRVRKRRHRLRRRHRRALPRPQTV